MNVARGSVWGAVALVVLTALLTGPAVSGVDVTAEPRTFDEGTATVADVELVDGPALDAGRFGTGVHYLRGPAARVTVRDVTGLPRLVLRVQAPALDYDETVTSVLHEDDRGQRRLSLDDLTVEDGAVPEETFTVQTTVRIQSFTEDRVVFSTNRSVGGQP